MDLMASGTGKGRDAVLALTPDGNKFHYLYGNDLTVT